MSEDNFDRRDAVITFLECEIVGDWQKLTSTKGDHLNPRINYSAINQGVSIRLVRPDEMIREFAFKQDSKIWVSDNAVSFSQKDVINEHSVDQDSRDGKRGNAKVVDPTED